MMKRNYFAEAIGSALLSGYTIDDMEYGDYEAGLQRIELSRFADGTVEIRKIFDIEAMTEESYVFDRIDSCYRMHELLHYDTESGEPVLEVVAS